MAKAAFNRGTRLAGENRLAQARKAYQAAIYTRDFEYGPRAAIALAELLERAGEVAGARAAYQAAIDSGHPDMAPAAADALGMMLAANRSDPRALDAAVAAFRHAAESGHPSYARGSGWTLGMLLGMHGDLAGARAAFRMSAQAGPAPNAQATMIRYAGILACEFGDFEGATAFLREVIDSGNLVHTRQARTELDMIEAADGDLDVYRRSVDATWA
jgi:tetratricopeptide (TPR) repeat protein